MCLREDMERYVRKGYKREEANCFKINMSFEFKLSF